ncbi:unnamed protein product [Protopolystoma xenopodis]|uniref:P-type domain-containing protein n=1 Tax=Protopolystoma xenopodis TaxID=117903 RepID=A0A3S5AN39_9PLAT|nr:unnamed protein product [Protopolystoma xenopodis]
MWPKIVCGYDAGGLQIRLPQTVLWLLLFNAMVAESARPSWFLEGGPLQLQRWLQGRPSLPEDACLEIRNNERLDCNPETGASQKQCEDRGCCWLAPSPGINGMPHCFFPAGYPSFRAVRVAETERGYRVSLEKQGPKYMPEEEFTRAQAEVTYETASRLRIRITMPEVSPDRWEPPIPLSRPDKQAPKRRDYKLVFEEKPFGLKASRPCITIILWIVFKSC